MAHVGEIFASSPMQDLNQFLESEIKQGVEVYPPAKLYFAAFDRCPFESVKVVILGQDPYHGPGQAHGLSFSVPRGIHPPPSLQNIFKELRSDLGLSIPAHGCLEYWADQGVLLLNAVLTVRAGEAASHQGKGWEMLTDQVIRALNAHPHPLVFMLWGSHAQKKAEHVDTRRHLVLKSTHPSPLSAHRGFLGCRHFSQANQFLLKQGMLPIDWSLT